jgi:hypothetical protein
VGLAGRVVMLNLRVILLNRLLRPGRYSDYYYELMD